MLDVESKSEGKAAEMHAKVSSARPRHVADLRSVASCRQRLSSLCASPSFCVLTRRACVLLRASLLQAKKGGSDYSYVAQVHHK